MDLAELTRQAFAAWNARRFDEVLEHFHEDAVWDMTPFGLAGVGEYRGHEGLRRFFAEWLETFPDSSIEVEDVEVRDPWTLSIVVQRVSGASSHAPVPFRYGGVRCGGAGGSPWAPPACSPTGRSPPTGRSSAAWRCWARWPCRGR